MPGESNKNHPDPDPSICSEAPCLFNVSSAGGDRKEQHDVSADHPDIVKRLLAELGAWAWECPDGLCTLDRYNGTAHVDGLLCEGLAKYGTFAPFADLPPPPPGPSPPAPKPKGPVVSFKQGEHCLEHGHGPDAADNHELQETTLLLGPCGVKTAEWTRGNFKENTDDPHGAKQPVPTLVGVVQGWCVHVDHHDKNGTCDGTPATNVPTMQQCAHGNAFSYKDLSPAGGELRNLNCEANWGSAGACLVSTATGAVVAGDCGGAAATWTLHIQKAGLS